MATAGEAGGTFRDEKASKWKGWGRWFFRGLLGLLIVSSALEGFFLCRVRQQLKDQAWTEIADSYTAGADTIQPDVGTIQFLKNGLSVSLSNANYTANGLELAGELGNTRNISISSITLHITAYRPIYECRDKYLKGESLGFAVSGHSFFQTCDDIGSGQTGVGDLAPGKKQFFTLTIPNVKQTKSEPDLMVFISGERYSLY